MAGTLNIVSSSITTNSGSKIIGPFSVSSASPIGQIIDLTFNAAVTLSFVCPAGATCAVISPPAASAVPLTLKGASGDTGVGLSPSQPSVISLGTTPVTLYLNASAAITGVVEVSFF